MRRWFILVTILLGLIPITFSQSFFGSSPTSSSPPSPDIHPNPVIAPQDFSNLVTTLDKQNKNNLSEQYSQQLSKQPPLVPPIPNQVNRPPQTNITVTPTGSTTTQTLAPLPQEPSPQPAPTSPDYQNQSAPYTGFGPGPTNNNGTPPANTDTTGSWNVKY